MIGDQSSPLQTVNPLDEKEKFSVRSVMNDPAGELEPPKKRKKPENSLELTKKWALEYLKRPHSEKELRTKLTQKGATEADIETVVALCLDYGFVNDEEYAGMIARHYAAMGYGPGRVRTELQRRGIRRELWDEALDNMPEPDTKLDKFIASRLRDPEDRDQVRKISAALYRRGYTWEEIRSALARYNAETEDY